MCLKKNPFKTNKGTKKTCLSKWKQVFWGRKTKDSTVLEWEKTAAENTGQTVRLTGPTSEVPYGSRFNSKWLFACFQEFTEEKTKEEGVKD